MKNDNGMENHAVFSMKRNLFYRRYKNLYMCKMHNILYLDKTRGNKPG